MTLSNEPWSDDDIPSERRQEPTIPASNLPEDPEAQASLIAASSNFAATSADNFKVGDHVYKWCKFGLVEKAYTHHGIVVGVEDTSSEDGADKMLSILDFCCASKKGSIASLSGSSTSFHPSSSCSSSSFRSPPKEGSGRSILRMKEESSKEWHKVLYFDTTDHPAFETAHVVTCTMVTKNDIEIVMARIDFVKKRASFHEDCGTLISNMPTPFPNYHALSANCECFAVWVATGFWCSLQGFVGAQGITASIVGSTVFGGATTGILVGTMTTTSTVAAGGVLGWLGFTTTQVVTTSIAATCPWLIPVFFLGSTVVGYRAKSLFDKSVTAELIRITDILTIALATRELEDDEVASRLQ